MATAQVGRDNRGGLNISWSMGENAYLARYQLNPKNNDELYSNTSRFFQFSCPDRLF